MKKRDIIFKYIYIILNKSSNVIFKKPDIFNTNLLYYNVSITFTKNTTCFFKYIKICLFYQIFGFYKCFFYFAKKNFFVFVSTPDFNNYLHLITKPFKTYL